MTLNQFLLTTTLFLGIQTNSLYAQIEDSVVIKTGIEKMINRRVDQMKQKLKLSELQALQLKNIIHSHYEKAQKISVEEKNAIDNILNEEQKKSLDDMVNFKNRLTIDKVGK